LTATLELEPEAADAEDPADAEELLAEDVETAAPAAPSDEIIRVRLRVPPECAGWRLDHFLKYRIRRLSRTKIQEIIAGQVRLEGGRPPRPALSVRPGEIVTIERPAPIEPPVPRHFRVLMEDDTFIAIDKPAGLPIHTTAKYWKNTLTAVLRERYPEERLQVCHRIDRETSGVLLVARGPEAGSALKQAFARRKVAKSYLALCHGIPTETTAVIDQPMRLLDTKSHIMMGIVPPQDPAGLHAVTRYEVLRTFAAHALVAASPETGRQHQIRVHLAGIGHPIVGDKMYRAGESAFIEFCDGGMTPELLLAFDGLDRHALHAHRLTFPHPRTREPITVECPLPPDLTAYIEALA
jgi:23S rRNA pseudouridine1911/1915/1917 synthase